MTQARHERTAQRPIGSGFGAHSTAAEVLDGIDLTGKLALVTGGYSGIGLVTTRALLAAGARVLAPARRPEVAAEQLPDGVASAHLDLSDLDSVRSFADKVLAEEPAIDLLIASAGIMGGPEMRVGDGWELQFATNHLGHFALVNRLWPALAAGGGDAGTRVVVVSSAGHRRSPIHWDDPQFTSGGYEPLLAYGQSKTANSLFAVHLDALGREHGIRAFAVHPGLILTPIMRHTPVAEQRAAGWLEEDGTPVGFARTPEQGAATQLWAATSPQLAGLGGVYCADCDIAELADSHAGTGPFVLPHAVDPADAARLWAYSRELVGL